MKNSGLTLIALVITIIILLILAGVTLSLTVGNNGVLTRTSSAEKEYNKSEVLEQLNIILTTEIYLDAYSEESGKNIDQYYNVDSIIHYLMADNSEPYTYIKNTETHYVVKLDPTLSSSLADYNSTDYDYYFVDIDAIDRKITNYAKGKNVEGATDYFYLRVADSDSDGTKDTITLFYVELDGTVENMGDLTIQQN